MKMKKKRTLKSNGTRTSGSPVLLVTISVAAALCFASTKFPAESDRDRRGTIGMRTAHQETQLAATPRVMSARSQGTERAGFEPAVP